MPSPAEENGGRYRKKPVVVEASQFLSGSEPAPDWLSAAFTSGQAWYQGGEKPYITIKTLEGVMRADPGDWIIRGVKGELYPCKPDVFEMTTSLPSTSPRKPRFFS